MAITVRRATARDIEPSVDVLLEVSAEPGSLLGHVDPRDRATIVENLRTWHASGRHPVFVALDEDERVIGSLWLLTTDGLGEVRLHVGAPWRGRGAGRAMLDAAEAFARATGFRKLWLGVYAPNVRAQALYARCGFEVEGVQRAQYRHPVSGEIWDVVLMGKLL